MIRHRPHEGDRGDDESIIDNRAPRRREYSAEFKTSVLEQCRQPGASLAGIALGYGINPNMVHRWIREDRQRLALIELQRGASAFVPLQLPPSSGVGAGLDLVAKSVQPAADQSAATEGIRVEIQIGASLELGSRCCAEVS